MALLQLLSRRGPLPLSRIVRLLSSEDDVIPDEEAEESGVDEVQESRRLTSLYYKGARNRISEKMEERQKLWADKHVFPTTRLSEQSQTNVDSVIGFTENYLKNHKRRRNDVTKPTDDVTKTAPRWAEYDSRIDRKLRTKFPKEYLTEGKNSFVCQYTKEMELRDYKAEDHLLKFPIDNQDIVWEESTVPFTEHISLHKYIAIFPPVTQRFMETVISALQNNPDLTIGKKKEIIWAYYNYFDFNADKLLEEEEVIQV